VRRACFDFVMRRATDMLLVCRLARPKAREVRNETIVVCKFHLFNAHMKIYLTLVCLSGDVLILEEAAYCDEGFFYVRSLSYSNSI